MAIREIQTATEIIDRLGGTTAMARLTGRKAQHVTNWRASGRLPADTFLIVTAALKELGFSAPPLLWGIAPANGSEDQSAGVRS